MFMAFFSADTHTNTICIVVFTLCVYVLYFICAISISGKKQVKYRDLSHKLITNYLDVLSTASARLFFFFNFV